MTKSNLRRVCGMESRTTELNVKISGCRIVDSTVLKDGSCRLKVIFKDDTFALIDASKLSLTDKFMRHKPTSMSQKELKEQLTLLIEGGLSDFWCSRINPSISEDGTELIFEAGKKPVMEKSYYWWEEKAKEYLLERESRLGTKNEYIAFLGVLIKRLAESGWTVNNAWRAVCNNIKGSEIYNENSKVTGSNDICGFFDIYEASRILAYDEDTHTFWSAGRGVNHFSSTCTLYGFCKNFDRNFKRADDTGWVVLTK